jgi:hypothetical protein
LKGQDTLEARPFNEPVYFNSGLVKVGRTLYTTTFRGTYAFDAMTSIELSSASVRGIAGSMTDLALPYRT